ncbi:MAG: acyl-CoA-binding protein [Gammaproteobacteria bacterium]|nr:acyl-CoA-binding protein [Gammaproteobacteria bacterium]
MDDLEQQFKEAAANSKKLAKRPDDDTLLKIYALYKQASDGDVSGDRPGFFDFVGAAKFDAWAGLRGKGRIEAMQEYIDLIGRLRGQAG